MPSLALRSSALLLASTALTAASPAFAQSLPTGASVVSGSVTLANPNARSLTVQQGSQNAIVNWQGFSIGQASSVTFQQPSATSAILNRVTGAAPSTLAGRLDANGQVFLVNPNGIAITKTGVVNAAGFVASTLAISDEDFRSGRLSFKGSGASAAASNAGTINVGRGGYAALIGGTVENSGVIEAPLGRVGLGSGEAATLDLSGDGFLQVAIPTRSGGDKALIRHSGTIRANGGRVVMTAATAREAARNAVNISGVVEARTVSGRSGAIVIGGGPGGAINISGRLSASGGRRFAGGTIAVSGKTIVASGRFSASGLKGGAITLNGASVTVTGRLAARGFERAGGLVSLSGDVLEIAAARLDVSGAKGGGAVKASAASSVSVDAATIIRADATKTGDGGAIRIGSPGGASVQGILSARGGASGGDGGKIETSGGHIDFAAARVDTTAPKGAAGSWLIDPTDITIGEAQAAAIEAGLQTANITVTTPPSGSEKGDITVAAPLSWSSAQSLTLNAANALAVNAPMTISGSGKLALIAAMDPVIPTLAQISFGAGASVQYTGTPNTGQALSVNGQTYTLLYSMADVLGVNANLAGRYALAKPLDAAGTTYDKALIAANSYITPGAPFTGAFQGLGNAISHLTIAADTYLVGGAGLFGVISAGGQVANLALTDAHVSITESDFAGALAAQNAGVIARSSVTGAVTGGAFESAMNFGPTVGGLVGYNTGVIAQSSTTAAVETSASGGGLAGSNAGLISDSSATGPVTGVGHYGNTAFDFVGGLVAVNSGAVMQSYATGAVSAAPKYTGGRAGGLAGSNSGTIDQSFASGAVSISTNIANVFGMYNAAGGLVASNSGTIDRSWASGSVAAEANLSSADYFQFAPAEALAGGLVGGNGGAVSRSYATGAASASASTGIGYANAAAGGLAGVNSGSANETYATGAASARSSAGNAKSVAGGLVGSNDGGVAKSYATGAATADAGSYDDSPFVTSVAAAGGLVGASAGTISGSYASGGAAAVNYAAEAANPNKKSAAGGLVGDNGGSIVQSYALGAARADSFGSDAFAGGLVGRNSGPIAETYATGAAVATLYDPFGLNPPSPSPYVGGLIGSNSGTVSSAYWDKTTTGRAKGVGASSGGSFAAKGLVTAQFSGVKNFPGWTFATTPGASGWVIVDNGGTLNNAGGQAGGTRPMLLSEYATTIVNGHQLQLVALDLAASYKLGADVDLGPALANPSEVWFTAANAPAYGYGFVPLGTWSPTFTGSFDGQGHTISNLLISRPNNANVALFGYVGNSGLIQNVHLVGGSVTGHDRVGALAGKNHGRLLDASAATDVYGVAYVGGLAGWSSGRILGSSASGDVSGSEYIGGLAGRNDGLVASSSASGNASGHDAIGGLVGLNRGAISQSHAAGVADSEVSAGGLVGTNEPFGSIFAAYSTGATIGAVVGGLVGHNAGSVKQTYATGPASVFVSFHAIGGLIGENVATGSVSTSYWDTQTTGQSAGAGVQNGAFSAAGLTTAQLKAALPAGFSPTIWGIIPGVAYPFLKAAP